MISSSEMSHCLCILETLTLFIDGGAGFRFTTIIIRNYILKIKIIMIIIQQIIQMIIKSLNGDVFIYHLFFFNFLYRIIGYIHILDIP